MYKMPEPVSFHEINLGDLVEFYCKQLNEEEIHTASA
jgi:hypothetical protein